MATHAHPTPRTAGMLRRARNRMAQWWSRDVELSDAEERKFAAEYAYAMGLHLTPDEQVVDFKVRTECAPPAYSPSRTLLSHSG